MIHELMQEMSVTDEELGTYGRKWLEWMQEQHPKKVAKMKSKGTLLAVAKSVDDDAWEYSELLERKNLKAHPYPNSFEENVRYHTTKNFYVDSAVMRERVLIAYSEP
jgi:hypothetical protein